MKLLDAKLRELLKATTIPDGCKLVYLDCDGLCVVFPDYTYTKRLHTDANGIYVTHYSGRKYYFNTEIEHKDKEEQE